MSNTHNLQHESTYKLRHETQNTLALKQGVQYGMYGLKAKNNTSRTYVFEIDDQGNRIPNSARQIKADLVLAAHEYYDPREYAQYKKKGDAELAAHGYNDPREYAQYKKNFSTNIFQSSRRITPPPREMKNLIRVSDRKNPYTLVDKMQETTDKLMERSSAAAKRLVELVEAIAFSATHHFYPTVDQVSSLSPTTNTPDAHLAKQGDPLQKRTATEQIEPDSISPDFFKNVRALPARRETETLNDQPILVRYSKLALSALRRIVPITGANSNMPPPPLAEHRIVTPPLEPIAPIDDTLISTPIAQIPVTTNPFASNSPVMHVPVSTSR